MNTITVQYDGVCPIVLPHAETASGQVGTLRVCFRFSAEWARYPIRTAVFWGSGEKICRLLDEADSCEVPSAILKQGGRIRVGAFANETEGEDALRYSGRPAVFDIPEGATPSGTTDAPEDVSMYEQMLYALQKKLDECDIVAVLGSGTPGEGTMAEAGRLYVDTENQSVYACVSAAEDGCTWRQIAGAGEIAALAERLKTLERTASETVLTRQAADFDGVEGGRVYSDKFPTGTVLSQYNTYYRSVQSGEIYYISTTIPENRDYGVAVFFAGDTFVSLVGAYPDVSGTVEEYEVEVPAGATMMRVICRNSSKVEPPSLKRAAAVTTQPDAQAGDLLSPLYYRFEAATQTLYLVSKFDAERDLVIQLAKRGPNQIFEFADFRFAPNKKRCVTSDLTDFSVWEHAYASGGDWHAPFQVKATENADGDLDPSNVQFTGGNHNYLNTGSLDSVPTGRTESVQIYADGRRLTESAGGYATRMEVRWTNLVQGSNTIKATGDGREILRERHVAVWDGREWRETVELTALEDVRLLLWYGLQFQGYTESGLHHLRFYGGTNRGLYAAPTVAESGGKSGSCVRAYGDTAEILMFYDPGMDLGTGCLHAGDSSTLFTGGDKVYCRIVDGENVLASGESVSFSGGYRFHPTTEA